MVEAGVVSGPTLVIGDREFAAGDHVLLRRNDRRLNVANGDRAVVVAVDVDREALAVRIGRRDVVLPRAYLIGSLRPTVQHGYAMTGHAAQGLTVDRAFVLATEEASREWLYMALSRGRSENRVYGATASARERLEFAPGDSERTAAEILELAVQRSTARRMAIDSRERRRSLGRDFGGDR